MVAARRDSFYYLRSCCSGGSQQPLLVPVLVQMTSVWNLKRKNELKHDVLMTALESDG
jgi:hypothetical protein